MTLHLLSSMYSGITKRVFFLLWIYIYLASSCWRYVSSSWWALGRTSLSSAHVGLPCSNIPGLTRPQRNICLKHPDIMECISRGAHLGIAGCQEQMKDRRWNCATVETGTNVFGKVTDRIGSREAAFVYAISSAGVVYSIAKACHSGDLANCACDPIKHGYFNDTEGEYSWQGCASFINYSSRFAKRFIDSREGAMKDSRALMNLHNNRAGRKAVKKFTKKLCKCHGVSGTCTVRTCWKSLRSFPEIGAFLKKRYDGAVQVTLQQHGNIITDKDFKPFTKFDLVYFESSPDYCVEDKNVGTFGISGRQCSKKSKGSGSCDVLCCGLGYDTRRVTVVNKCNCKFHYCCSVTCDECQETKDIYSCKTTMARRANDTRH